MATAAITTTAPDTHLGYGRTLLNVSASMANGDNTASIPMMGFDAVSVQITGTFGAGGSVAVEGSHDGTNFFALPGISGGTLAIIASSIVIIPYPTARFIRAHVTAGDGTTALIASILLATVGRP